MSRKARQRLFGKGFVASNAMNKTVQHGGITHQIRIGENRTVTSLKQDRSPIQTPTAPWVSRVAEEARVGTKVVRGVSERRFKEQTGEWSARRF